MECQLLLTSFATWKPEQLTNSSDDLLLALQQVGLPSSIALLRQIPVDFAIAPQQAIAHFEALQPQGIVCFGMAESRDRLDLERRAIGEDQTLETSLHLEVLKQDLRFTRISDDAGRFVCNGLYLALLEFLQARYPDRFALFVHVPILTPENRDAILLDVWAIINRLALGNIPTVQRRDVPSIHSTG